MNSSVKSPGLHNCKSWTAALLIATDYLRLRRLPLALAFCGLLTQAILSLPIPICQGMIIDQLAANVPFSARGSSIANHPGSFRIVGWLIMLMIGCHVARNLVSTRIAAMMSRVTLEVVRELTDALHRKLQRLQMHYFDREPTGHIMARLTSDVGSLLLFLNVGSLQLVSDLVLAAGIALVLFWLEWRLALIGMLALPLFFLNHRWFVRSIHDHSHALRDQVSALYAQLSDRIPAIRVVRSFTNEDAELVEFDARLNVHRSLSLDCMNTVVNQGAWSSLINGLGVVAVLSIGAWLVERHMLTVGELLAFSALLAQLYQPIGRLTGAQAMIAGTLVAADRIVELLDEPEPNPSTKPTKRISVPRGHLIYRDVSFAYPSARRYVLHDINLEIEPGMTLGIMGSSGAGKSTLLSLAPRLYDLTESQGSILFDGYDIRELDVSHLRRLVSLVPQQAILFEGTIRSNLTYAAPLADRAAINRALEMTDLADWIVSQPSGLDTPVGERGQTLSGGQRQRLALARAMIADPSIVLLDDSTSAVDGETESRIHAALAEFLVDRSCIIVSHKVASIRDADCILILDKGRIIEQGSHATLIRTGGPYAQAYEQQTSALVKPNHIESVQWEVA